MERPKRSDVHLAPEEEAKREEEAGEFFDGIAPKRHWKPMRSEYSSLYQDALAGDDVDHGPIPELSKFQQLENQSMDNLVYTTSEAGEEFVETEYYKDLNCIEKQHPTTGSGCIKMEKATAMASHLLKMSLLLLTATLLSGEILQPMNGFLPPTP